VVEVPGPRGGPRPRSSIPKGLRNLTDWSHRDGPRAGGETPALGPPRRLVDATVPTARRPNRTPAVPTPAHRAGFPQGFTNLSTTCDRPNCQRIHSPTPPAGATSPVQGCHAGRLTVFAVVVLTSGESYLNREIAAVNILPRIISIFRGNGRSRPLRNAGVSLHGTSISKK
jgi:hypothetical protein